MSVIGATRGRVRRRAVAALLMGAVIIPATFVSPAGADVNEVGGGGYALSVQLGTLLGPVSLGPISEVDLPSNGGGPITNSVANVNLPGIVSTGLLEASTEGGNLGSHQGFATSDAIVADPEVLGALAGLLGGPLLTADAIEARCISNGDGSTGETTLANASLAGFGILDVEPAPNTTLNVLNLVTVTLNEQIVNNVPGQETSIVVNAIRISVNVLGLVTGDVVISHVECAAYGPDVLNPEPPPTTTGPGGPGGPGGPATPIAAAPRFTG
jgi:hypothetical protein